MKNTKRIPGLFLTLMLAVSVLSGCSSKSANETAAAPATESAIIADADVAAASEDTDTSVATAGADAEEAAAKPSLDELSGDDLLREDYYEYVNRRLLNATEIPPSEVNWSWFYELSEDAYNVLDDALADIIENRDAYVAGSDEQMIADFYLTYLDTDTRDSAGLGPVQKYLDAIQNAADIQEYMEAVSRYNGDTGSGSIIILGESIDSHDSTRYVEQFYGMDLGLGKETLMDDTYDDLMPDYEHYISVLLAEAGYGDDEAASYAIDILSFIKEMAAYSLDRIDFYDTRLTYNVYTKEDLAGLFTNFDVEAYLAAGGYDDWDLYIVVQEELFKKINEILTEDNLDLLKAYSSFCLVQDICDLISMDVDEAELEFELEFFGVSEAKTLERRASEAVQSIFGFEFGKLYVDRCFTGEDKESVTQMVQTLIEHYRERIGQLDWLSDASKQKAIKKLDTMAIKVGYPDVWPEYYNGAELKSPEEGGSLIENYYSLLCAMENWYKDVVKKPVDRTMWSMTPQTVNAYYNPSMNEIVFPAGILQDPFYSPDEPDSTNYGGIGSVIAHEITHAFDASGSQYDEVGNYDPWWTDEDAENFAALTQKVVDYYDTMEVGGRHVNGALTVNENIADLGAMNTVTSYFEGDTEALDRLFHKNAAIWAYKATDEYQIYQLNNDTHSPARIRVDAVLKTLDCFYDTYPEIQEGDGMYLAPEDRVRIW